MVDSENQSVGFIGSGLALLFLAPGCDVQKSNKSQPTARVVATEQSNAGTWKVESFQDAAIDPTDRSTKTQQARRTLIDTICGNVTPPNNQVVTAQVLPIARDGWYSDDVARKHFAGMVYAYYFADDSGEVKIYDGERQVGNYLWANGPQYSDVVAESTAVETTKPETTKPKTKKFRHDIRTWTSADGSRTFEAKFKYRVNNLVVLEKPDGSEIKVSLDKFSEEDQDYARGKFTKAIQREGD